MPDFLNKIESFLEKTTQILKTPFLAMSEKMKKKTINPWIFTKIECFAHCTTSSQNLMEIGWVDFA